MSDKVLTSRAAHGAPIFIYQRYQLFLSSQLGVHDARVGGACGRGRGGQNELVEY